MAVFSSNSWIRRGAETTVTEFGVPPEAATRGLTLAAACSRHEIDALVSASPVLQLPYWKNLRKNARAATPEEAVALLGLYLRARNDYTVDVDGNHATFLEDRRFYPAAAVATLPRYLMWLSAAVTAWKTSSDPIPFGLVKGLAVRLGRGLRARDYFNVRVRSPRPDDAWDEALPFFETALVSLNGALDAAARFCRLAYHLSGPPRRANWSRPEWRNELIAMAPELESLLDPTSGPLVPSRTLVSLLRNYIHGEALSQELFSGSEEGPVTMDYGIGALAVTAEDGRRLQVAAEVHGGSGPWGLQEQYNGDVLVLPAPFLQRVVATVLGVLDELMTASEARVGTPTPEPPTRSCVLAAGRRSRAAVTAPHRT
jgi:hypothetical protein